MQKRSLRLSFPLSLGLTVLSLQACNALAAVTPATTALPSPVPATATFAPPLSQRVTLVSVPLNETSQNPPYAIDARIPQLTGSEDPRVTAFNQRINELVKKEVDAWRENFRQITLASKGSSLDERYSVISQIGDLWSLKLDFRFYSDGAAHPGLYSITLNYDLGHGRELALGDLFIPNSNYLETIASYCIAELGRQPGFEGPFTDGAKPTPENYRNWNITPEGVLITFDMYQVAPGASGPLQVLVPYDQLKGLIDPQGVLAEVTK